MTASWSPTAHDGVSGPAHVCSSRFPFEELVRDPTVPFFYWPTIRAWGIPQLVNEALPDRWWKTSHLQKVGFCPWCGRPLPRPLERERFEALRALGLRPGDPSIPQKFFSDLWWRELGHGSDDHVDHVAQPNELGRDVAEAENRYRYGRIEGRVLWLED